MWPAKLVLPCLKGFCLSPQTGGSQPTFLDDEDATVLLYAVLGWIGTKVAHKPANSIDGVPETLNNSLQARVKCFCVCG